MADRYSDEYREGKKEGYSSYSRYGYDNDKYDHHGSRSQENYADGWDAGREEKEWEERMREEREEQERQERRQEFERQQYEQQMYEQQQHEEQMAQQEQEQQIPEPEESNPELNKET